MIVKIKVVRPEVVSTGLITHHDTVERRLKDVGCSLADSNDNADILLHLGNRLIKTQPNRAGQLNLLWPLNVSPFLVGNSLWSCFSRREQLKNLGRLAQLRRSASQSDGVIFSSVFTRSVANKFLPVALPKVVWPTYPELRPSSTKELPPGREVLCVSHRYRYKKVESLVERFLKSQQLLEWGLTLVGGGPVQSVESAIAALCQSRSRVKVEGVVPREEVAQSYRSAGFFALPTLIENAAAFPIQEAFGLGVPVAVSPTEVNKELLGKNHQFVDFGLGFEGVDLSAFASETFRQEVVESQGERQHHLRAEVDLFDGAFVDWISQL